MTLSYRSSLWRPPEGRLHLTHPVHPCNHSCCPLAGPCTFLAYVCPRKEPTLISAPGEWPADTDRVVVSRMKNNPARIKPMCGIRKMLDCSGQVFVDTTARRVTVVLGTFRGGCAFKGWGILCQKNSWKLPGRSYPFPTPHRVKHWRGLQNYI